jgi:general secretion pathway protein D
VSSIVREVTSRSGTLTYQIGTRSAATNLRLRDGETQVLAGLINDEDRNSAQRVPGFGDLPIIGRLFSNERKDGSKTEVVLLITPRIVRNLARPGASAMEFSSGTEGSSIGTALGARRYESLPTPPAPNQPRPEPPPSGVVPRGTLPPPPASVPTPADGSPIRAPEPAR